MSIPVLKKLKASPLTVIVSLTPTLLPLTTKPAKHLFFSLSHLTNFKANHIYSINGNDIKETFVNWDKEKNKCFAGFTVTGSNVGINETITVSGEVLSFFNTGIDTRVYFIKNF